MKSAKKLIVGNWKMNPPTLEAAKKIFSGIKRLSGGVRSAEVALCPPALYLPALKSLSSGSRISLGAQDIFEEPSGAFTGFLSPEMCKSAGADYCLVGHSERRARGETDQEVNRKLLAVLRGGMRPIVCIGESERSQSGAFLEFIHGQLQGAFAAVKKQQLKNIIIAYEPIWAIGAAEAMNPRDLHQMTLFIKKVLSSLFPDGNVLSIPILYGGSVDAQNCAEILAEGEAQGLLVGRASLDPVSFGEIVKIASSLA